VKGIPFETHWLDLHDVQAVAAHVGAKPTIKLPDGGSMYTLPIIYDPSTGKVVADSLPIAEYLDAAYPSHRRIIIPGTIGLTRAAVSAIEKEITNLYPFLVPGTLDILPEASRGYFRVTREAFLGATLEDMLPKGEVRKQKLAKLKDIFDNFAGWYDVDEGKGVGEARKWITGDQPTFPDLVIAGAFQWLWKVLGEDSEEWKEMKEWNGGRWGQLMDNCRLYEGEY
jgi:glutathione S-transferase